MSFLFKKNAAQDLSGVSAATDAAEYRVVHAKGVGKWWVEPNVSMFGGEWGKGRKEFASREEAEKYAKGTGKTYIVRDECEGDDVAQDSLPTVGGYITLKKDGKKYKILKDWGGGEYIVADPNGGDFQVKYYEHLEGLKHYGEDAAQFKVGDKIWVDPSYGANLNIGYGWNVGIVKRVGTGHIDVDFKGQVISVPAPYCARVNSSGKPVFDSAAMDGRGDIRMTLHAAESQIAGVVNVFTNHAVDKTAKEIAAIDELKGVIGIIHKVASVF